MKQYILAILMIAFVMSITSCNRVSNNNNNSKDNDTETAGDYAMGENFYQDVQNIADDASSKQTGDNLGEYKTASNCATVTHDTLSNPKLIIIDFGPTNCLCNDNRYRRGKILVSYLGKYRDAGSVHTITFDGYYINNHQILGSKTVTNNGKNNLNQSYFTVQVNGMIVKSPSGDTISWNSLRTRTWLQGEATPQWFDDVYSITGNGSGNNKNGAYTIDIVTPLMRSLDCKWIKQGIIHFQPTGKALRIIDFGNGICDDDATVTVNNNTFNIKLK